MVNSSRYIGSDQGYKMQSDALTNLTNATAQANQTVTQSFQGALAGQVEVSKQMLNLIQAKSQADVVAASRPNSFSQLAEAGLKAYMAYEDNQQKKAAEQVKQQQEIINDTEYANTNQQLSDLIAKYDGDNWNKGQEQFKADAAAIVANYRPKNKEQAGYYIKLLETVNNAYQKRSELVGGRLREEIDKQRISKKQVAGEQLRSELLPLYAKLPSVTDATERSQLQESAYKRLNEWKAQQLNAGVPEADVNSIVAEQLGMLNQQLMAGGLKESEISLNLRNNAAASQKWQEYHNAYLSGKMSFEDMTANQRQLEIQYPGFVSGRMAKLGDEEEFKQKLIRLNLEGNDLNQRVGNQAVAQAPLTDATVNAIGARLALLGEPSIKALESTPGIKDNPRFIEAFALARSITQFREDYTKVKAENQQLLTQIASLNLTDANNFANLTKQIYSRPADQINPGDAYVQQALSAVYGQLPPEYLATLQQGKDLTPDQLAKLQEALNLQSGAIRGVQDSLQQQIQINNAGLQQKYAPLIRRGLAVDIPQLEQLAKTATPLIDQATKQTEQLKNDAVQNAQPKYGVQPNFNPSSQYAPIVDDNDKLVLVPRSQAQRVTLADGSTAVTPILNMGNRTSVTSLYGMRTHPVHGDRRFHAGVDFAAPVGTRSVALVSGTVVFTGNLKGYGGTIDVLGDNGLLYRYAHQQSLVKPGQRVVPGTAVASSNGSGVGTGAHLHFEVRTPQFRDGKYDVNLNFGQQNTQDPLKHLQALNAGDSNILTPRGNTTAFRQAPTLKAPGNSTLLSNGGVVNANLYQRVGSSTPAPVNKRFTNQRPMSTGSVPGKVKLGAITYDYNDDLGYAELRKDPKLMRAFHETAKRIGVPTAWLVDIVRQETGGINPYLDHSGLGNPNQNYGLFGFGSDSGFSKEEFARLRAGQIDGAGQLKMFERYLNSSGWQALVKRRNGNVTIADLWASTKMGWKMRHKFWETGDVTVKSFPGTNLTYADELALLGKWVGRRYDIGGSNSRRERNAAVSDSSSYTSPLSQSLSKHGTQAPIRRPTAYPPSVSKPITGRRK